MWLISDNPWEIFFWLKYIKEEEEYEEYPTVSGAVGGVTATAGPSTSTSHVPAYLPVVDPDGQISDIAAAAGGSAPFSFFVPGSRDEYISVLFFVCLMNVTLTRVEFILQI